MKRKFLVVLFAIVAALCMAFGLAACGESTNTDNTGNGGSQTEQPGGNTGSGGTHEHSWGSWRTVTEAECEKAGVKRRSCTVCNQTEEEPIPALRHNLTDIRIKLPTCTEKGSKTGMCSICGKTETEETPAYGHLLTEHEGVQATCTTAGTKQYWSCSRCYLNFADQDGQSRLLTIDIAALGHAFETYTSNGDATCTKNATETATCSRCSEQNTREVKDSALGHEWDDGVVTQPATCTTAGVRTYTCAHDPDHHKTEVIEADPSAHSYGNWVPQIDAQCEETGKLGHFQCEYCHKNFDDQHEELPDITIAQLDHEWDDGQITQPATCTAEGVKTYTCNRDPDHHKTEEIQIDPAAHEYGDWVDQKDATCTKEGELGHYQCAYCRNYFDRTYQPLQSLTIEKLPHQYGAWQEEIPTSCTAPGRKGYQECESCHLKYDREEVLIEEDDLTIAQLDHNYEFDYVVTKTCQTAGYVVKKCSMCQEATNETISDISALVYQSGLSVVNGRITSAGFTAAFASGGYGKLLYKWELFSSETSTTPTQVADFSDVSTASPSNYLVGLNGQVVQVTIKDNYSNYSVFRCAVKSETNFPPDLSERTQPVEVFEGEHDFQNDFCTRCKKQESSVGLVYITSGNHCVVAGMGTCTDKNVVIAAIHDGVPVTEIGEAAFKNQDGIVSVKIPSSITKIGKEAFYDCDGLTEVTIPDSVTEMGEGVFRDCGNLQTASLGSGLKTIPAYIFYWCSKLSDFTIPASIKSIGSSAFSLSHLKKVTFAPNSELTTIGSLAFQYCDLTEITIPKNVTSIGYHAFNRCDNLQSVTFRDPTGWQVCTSSYSTSGSDLEESHLQDKNIAAVYLVKTYADYYWKKKA